MYNEFISGIPNGLLFVAGGIFFVVCLLVDRARRRRSAPQRRIPVPPPLPRQATINPIGKDIIEKIVSFNDKDAAACEAIELRVADLNSCWIGVTFQFANRPDKNLQIDVGSAEQFLLTLSERLPGVGWTLTIDSRNTGFLKLTAPPPFPKSAPRPRQPCLPVAPPARKFPSRPTLAAVGSTHGGR